MDKNVKDIATLAEAIGSNEMAEAVVDMHQNNLQMLKHAALNYKNIVDDLQPKLTWFTQLLKR